MGLTVFDMAQFLVDEGIVPDANMKAYRMWPTPDFQVATLTSGGEAPQLTHDLQRSYDNPRIQILVRHPDPEQAFTVAEAAYQRLKQCINRTIGGDRYLAAMPLQTPFLVDDDDNGRTVVGFNLAVQKGA